MAKKRSHRKPRAAHHDEIEYAPSVNGFDHADALHSDDEGAEPASGCIADIAADGADASAPGILAVGSFLSRILYTASYSASYGVVFPVMLLAHSVPTDNALVRGMIDGGRAARQAVAALYDDSYPAESAATAPAKLDIVTA
ncbi:MAG: hypothetical protein P4L84_33755 [Isosphaeraceae bacterium]|nr:hypothetical protein [Isosphaeraceae bacterium]